MTRRFPLLLLLLGLLASASRAEEETAKPDLATLEARLVELRAAGDERGAADTLKRIAAQLVRLERFDEALERGGEAIEAYRALDDAYAVTSTLYARAVLQMALQRFADAEQSYAAGLEAQEGAKSPRAAVVLGLGLSHARRAQGNAAGALEAAHAALEIQEGLGDPCRSARARCSVGTCLYGLGRYAQALEAHQQALEVFQEHDDASGMARALTCLGNVHLRIGNFPEARSCYEEALGLYRASKHGRNIAVTLGNLGILHEAVGELELARARHEEALGILEADTDRRRLAGALTSAGVIDMRLGRYEEALAKERRAFELYEALEDRAGMASTLVNAANIQERQGRLSDARSSCDRADAILGKDAPPARRAAVMWSRSRVFLAAKQAREAADEARRAIALISGLTQGLADQEQAGGRDVYDGLFDVAIRAAVELDDAEELAWALEQSRAVVLRDGLAARCALEIGDVSDDLCRDVAEAQKARRDATERYRRARRGQVLDEIRAAQVELEEADDAFQAVMRRVERKSKEAAALLDTEPSDLLLMQAQVMPTEALVLYGLAEEVAVALVVRRDEVRTVRLGPSQPILDAVRALDAGERKRPLAEIEATAARLRALLAGPLALPDSVRRVLVSPVGTLGFVPFCLLFPRRDVAYMPSGTTYGQLRGGAASRGQGILALGDPDYRGTYATDLAPDDETDDETDGAKDDAGATRDGTKLRLPRLAATRDEVEEIGTVKLLGSDASEARLASALREQERWRAIHFACHGFVDRERPMLSSLALSGDATNDGFLECAEIWQLRMPTDLVVLSACETGRGRIYRTEGIYGLTRAFLFAGADRVLCSLWLADDAATKALMVRFYELWAPEDGDALGAAAALRQAQAFVRDHPKHPEWKHPYYWAAWVLWGLPD